MVNNTMYVVTAFPNYVYRPRSHQARRAAEMGVRAASASRQRRASPAATWSIAAASTADGKIFFNTLDGQTIALDANTGKQLWRTKLGDINIGETITMAPLVVKGKVLVGNSGGEFGVRGWLPRSTPSTGKVAWKAYSTGPDKDVLIGAGFHPFYADGQGQGSRRQDLAAGRPGRSAAAHVWGWIAYDPDLNLIYYGTGNPGPWNQEQRPGDNKWTARHLRPRSRHRRGEMVLPDATRTTSTITTASTRSSCSTCRSTASRARCCCTPTATAIST